MNNKKYFLVALTLIVILGAGLRIYNLGTKSFDRDEFFELNSSYGYYKTGSWVAWDFGNEKPFDVSLQDKTSTERAEIYRWQLAKLYHFFEPSEAVTRSISVFWGIFSIILIYFVALSFTGNRWIALLAAFLVAVGESGIIYSRRLRMYSMLFPAYLAFSWLVYKFYEKKYEGRNKLVRFVSDNYGINLVYLLPTIVAGLISYNVHMLTSSIVATIAAFSVCGWILWEKKQGILNKYSITIGLLTIAYLFISSVPAFAKLYKSFKKQLDLFRFNSDYFSDYFNDFMFPLLGFIFIAIGAWYLYEKMEKKKESIFLLLSAFVPLVFAILTWTRTPAQRYINFAQSFGIILIAVGVYAAAQYLYGRSKKAKKTVAIIFLLVFVATMDFSYFKKENQIYEHTKNSFYPNFRNIFPYILKNKKEDNIFVTRAYRSYYWRGEKIRVLDVQQLALEEKNCKGLIEEIISKNKSGWFILPDIDDAFVCKDGREYLSGRFEKIKSEFIPNPVSVYKW